MRSKADISQLNLPHGTVLIIKNATVSKSQNVKDSSHGNEYLRKIKTKISEPKYKFAFQLIGMQTSYVTAPPAEQS